MKLESPVRILAIDDNRDDLTLLRHTLLKMGVAVLVAENAEEGLRVARAEQPDVMLCDIGLPGMDGYQFVKACKTDPVLQRIPTIALTGQEPAVANESMALQAGFDGFFPKSADSRLIERAISMLLRDDDHRGQMLHRMLSRREMDDLVLRVGRLEQGQEAHGKAIEAIHSMQTNLGNSLENLRVGVLSVIGQIGQSVEQAKQRNETLFASLGMICVLTLLCVIYVAVKVAK